MDSEAAPELIFDQGSGLYYPAASDYYGYYYTGPEPLNDWDSHHQFFGLDGQDLHISAMQTESLPNVYYIPSYGYVQSPYNPYNPSIPGAVMGTEGSFIETPYPANPPHQLVVSSPAYIPVGFDSSSVAVPNSYINPFLTTTGALPATKPDGEGKRLAPSPPLAPMNKGAASLVVASEHLASRAFHPSSYQSITTPKLQEASVANTIATKQSSGGALASGSIPGVNQASNPLANVKVSSVYRPAKVALPASNGFPNYGSSFSQWTTGSTGDKYRPRFQINDGWASKSGNLTEQNRGPRTDISKCRWTSPLYLKAYTTKAGTGDSQGNIIISADRYNRDDFPIDYEEAKCFVIKSYSEDDVHKSIKYNVWSSTPSGNKRLDNAFGEAQKLSAGRPQKCPIFLFFSVNASGQFCGVAEMMGPVDFQKDMDFWQQDKWLGSFPVKWHIIKDVSNISLRHILLENNEYKPVTCSRDTQEIPLLQGMAMLRIFKNAPLETSILDDFMHYEERQRIWFEEKTRIYGRRYDPQFFPAAFVPSRRVDAVVEEDTTAPAEEPAESAVKETSAAAEESTESDEREAGNGCDGESLKSENQQNGIVVQGSPDENRSSSANCGDSNVQLDSTSKVVQQGGGPSKARDLVMLGRSREQLDADGGVNSVMKIGGSLHIDSKSGDDAVSMSAQNDVITVGSMHIKVGKHACPPGVLTVGSIPIAPNGF